MATKTEFLVNDLSSSEITFFYQFLYYYETVFKKYKNNKEIKPIVSEFDEYIKNNNIKLYGKRKSQVPNSAITAINEIYFTNSKTIVLSFLSHLRNSIAHCHLVANGEFYILKDYLSDGTTLTMNGNIETKHLHELIKIFIKPKNN